jgi:Cdc6-like AAA superfamily ATPase
MVHWLCRPPPVLARITSVGIRPLAPAGSTGSPGVMYVCGVPGTGKTAIIGEVLKAVMQHEQDHRREQQQLQQASSTRPQGSSAGAGLQLGGRAVPGIQVVSINALSLPTPTHVYTKVRVGVCNSSQSMGPWVSRGAQVHGACTHNACHCGVPAQSASRQPP